MSLLIVNPTMFHMTLEEQLNQLREKMRSEVPQAMKAIDQSHQELKREASLAHRLQIGDRATNFSLPVPQKARQSGEKAINFSLPNATGQQIELRALLRKGPVVLHFYRGGWCPYCNLELMALQRSLSAFTNLNAQLVAITPEAPDHSLSTKEKNQLAFPVLTDQDNEIARSFGIIYQVPTYLQKVYEGFGVDLSKHNASGTFELPIPATYVISQDFSIQYAFVSEDFTQRASIEEVLAVLTNLQQGKIQQRRVENSIW